jgi:hypothetical protein
MLMSDTTLRMGMRQGDILRVALPSDRERHHAAAWLSVHTARNSTASQEPFSYLWGPLSQQSDTV